MLPSHRSVAAVALLVSLGCTAACSSGGASAGLGMLGGTAESSETMSITKECLATRCEKKQRDGAEACSDCRSACSAASYDCDPRDACEASCEDRECSDSDNECGDTGFKVTLPKTADQGLEAACNRLLAARQACGVDTMSASDCTLFAKTEKPEMAALYDCAANLPCDATDTSSCDAPPTTLGDDLADPTKVKCPFSLGDDGKAILDYEGGWLRADVIAAVQQCANLDDCDDMGECYTAWYSAVVR